MRKFLALIVASLAMTLGLVAVPDTPAEAHSNTAYNVCQVGDAVFFGAEPNEVGVLKSTTFHYYGLHYYKCCFWSLRWGFKVEGVYLEGWDEWSWPTGDPWCPGS